MDTALVVNRTSSAASRSVIDPPADWIIASHILAEEYSLAVSAHGSQRRPTDHLYLLEHVLEVAGTLHQAGFDDELVAVGLLHDAVERGTLTDQALRDRMGADISSLVLALSEDPGIASFDQRKAGLRDQVERAGGPRLQSTPPTSFPTLSVFEGGSRCLRMGSRSEWAPVSRA